MYCENEWIAVHDIARWKDYEWKQKRKLQRTKLLTARLHDQEKLKALLKPYIYIRKSIGNIAKTDTMQWQKTTLPLLEYKQKVEDRYGFVHPHPSLGMYSNCLTIRMRTQGHFSRLCLSKVRQARESKWLETSRHDFAAEYERWYVRRSTTEKEQIISKCLSENKAFQQEGKLPRGYYIDYTKMLKSEVAHILNLKGLFTKIPRSIGDLLGIYEGEVRTEREWNTFMAEEDFTNYRQDVYGRTNYLYEYSDDQNRQFIIDAFDVKKSSFVRFLNTPYVGELERFENCIWQKVDNGGKVYVAVFALRNIAEGEELCIHYGCKYWFSRHDIVVALHCHHYLSSKWLIPLVVPEKDWTSSKFIEERRKWKHEMSIGEWKSRRTF